MRHGLFSEGNQLFSSSSAIGLDLRNFDDAVTFKMMMLLGKNTVSRKFRL